MARVEQMVLLPAERVEDQKGAGVFDDSHLEQEAPMDMSSEPIAAPMTTPSQTKSKKKTVKPFEKLEKILKIVLRLANVNGYDIDGRVLDDGGHPVIGSNVISLLYYVLNPGTNRLGEEEFIKRMYQAHIDPALITNAYVKSRLEALYREKGMPKDRTPPSRTYVRAKRQLDHASNPPPPAQIAGFKRKAGPDADETSINLPHDDDERAQKRVTKEWDIKTSTPYRFDNSDDDDDDDDYNDHEYDNDNDSPISSVPQAENPGPIIDPEDEQAWFRQKPQSLDWKRVGYETGDDDDDDDDQHIDKRPTAKLKRSKKRGKPYIPPSSVVTRGQKKALQWDNAGND